MAESALSLVERLRAALDRAEEIARAAQFGTADGEWRVSGVGGLASGAYVLLEPRQNTSLGSRRVEHIAANGPAHVLRTVAAHRKILDALAEAERLREASARSFARLLERRAPADDLHGEKARALDLCGRVAALESAVADLAAVYFPEAPDA